MSSAKPSPNIIDLTKDSVPEYITVGSDSDDNKQAVSEAHGAETDKVKRRARKKKRRKVATSADTTAAEEEGEVVEIDAPVETQPSASSSLSKKPRRRREKASKATSDRRSRSRSPPRKRKRSLSPQPDIFFVDTKPTALPSYPEAAPSKETSELLLPTHVRLFDDATTVVQILPQDSEDDENIEFLDGDDDRRKDIIRYYDEGVSTKRRLICKHCGAEDQHSTRECHVKICLTCGARDEHTTMSCPISKTCFNCGMKGHISANCPNRRNSGAMLAANRNDCDRCGSNLHTTNECPTWWRIYTYETPEQRAATLSARKAKADIPLGEGGEGYIAEDEWCYNCGSNGHWGDDCQDMAHSYDIPPESSAFSKYNLTSGPFADEPSSSNGDTKRRIMFRDWERDEDLPAANVGRQGRQAQMRRQQRQQERDEEDQDDWFGDRRNAISIQGAASKKKTMTFGSIGQQKGRWEKNAPPLFSGSKPSLLERLDSGNDRSSRKPSSSSGYGGGGGSHDQYESQKKDKRRHRDRDRERDSERSRPHRDHERSRDGERDRKRSRQLSPDRNGSRRRGDSSRSHDYRPNHSSSTRNDKEPPTGPRYRGGYSR